MTGLSAIITVGNEILDGIVLDTNSQWITNRMKPLGLMVNERFTVRDDINEIVKAITRSIDDGCKLIITCGGLGPTHDDMTLKGVAEAFKLDIELNSEALTIVSRQYKEIHKQGIIESAEITEARKKMALLPTGAKPLDNRVGGAPGVLLEKGGVRVIALPGVPSELTWIFDNQVIPILETNVNGIYYEEVLNLPLRDESTLAPLIDEAMKANPNVWIKSMVKPYGESGIRIWVSSRGDNKEKIEKDVKKTSEFLIKLVEKKLMRG